MTVGELRKHLENYHEHQVVLVQGFEGGYDRFGFKEARVTPTEQELSGWWYGAYEDNEESGSSVLILTREKENS